MRVESNYCLAIDGAGQLYKVPSRFLRDSDCFDDFTFYGSSEMFELAHELRRRTKTKSIAENLKKSIAEAYRMSMPSSAHIVFPRRGTGDGSVDSGQQVFLPMVKVTSPVLSEDSREIQKILAVNSAVLSRGSELDAALEESAAVGNRISQREVLNDMVKSLERLLSTAAPDVKVATLRGTM